MNLNIDEIFILENGMEQLGINVFTETLEKFSLFIEELLFWNRRTNLVGTNNVREIIVKHILDSLSIYPLLGSGILTILDIGSGAGFPGIPLAVVSNRFKVTAVEKRSKRAGFLRNTSNILRLNNFEVIEKDIRDVNSSKKYDVITARGFGDLLTIYKTAKNYVEVGGMIIAFKGKISELEKEVSRLKENVNEDEIRINIEEVKVPYLDNEERHVVIIETK